jgi:hypothetical protein
MTHAIDVVTVEPRLAAVRDGRSSGAELPDAAATKEGS